MSKRMTLYIHDEKVYNGLISVVGKGNISNFIENLVRPIVVRDEAENDLTKAYQSMAQDEKREKEASEWINGCIGDVEHEAW